MLECFYCNGISILCFQNRKHLSHQSQNPKTEILILGTLPGERSLQMQEYYAHPQNRFWKIIAKITNSELPANYTEKRDLLLTNNIGLWDIVQQASRIGSLDSNIVGEMPNDLDRFISEHRNVKVVGFNGAKALKLFDKYFVRRDNLRYVALPSSSPANARISFDDLCECWREIKATAVNLEICKNEKTDEE